ncbi:MAG: glycosyltransferase family 9 protein [Candidatus Melainabacteria bacterium]|nr:glycosyltransferase family 9 protein [Candidatus Melainabacteria bacterium]
MQQGLATRIPGLRGYLDEVDFDPASLDVCDRYFDLRNHELQSKFTWGSKEFAAAYPGYSIADVVREISKDLGIPALSRLSLPLAFKKIEAISQKILFIAGSAGSMKCWPAKYCLELANRFKQSQLESVVIGRPEESSVVDEVRKGGMEFIDTPTLESALDVISSAKMVIGVDTGLTHLALNQGIATVMLFRYNSIYQRPFDNLICLKAPECLEKCLISELKGEFHLPLGYSNSDDFYQRSYWQTWHCHEEEVDKRCMAQISVDTVFNAAKDLMDREVKPIK